MAPNTRSVRSTNAILTHRAVSAAAPAGKIASKPSRKPVRQKKTAAIASESRVIFEKFNLNGKNALVTGSDKGLGAGIARALAQAGANIAFHARTTAPQAMMDEVRAMGRKTCFVAGDLSDSMECSNLITETVRELGSIDILVNNAGTIRRAPIAEFSQDDWDHVIAVNLSAVFHLSRLAGIHMLQVGKGGKIVNIASLLSFQGGILVPSYAAAKGGVAQLTKALANEWASKGINVNAIAPGYMVTDNTEALRNDPQRSKQIMDRIPASRWGEPGDLAGAAVFLCSSASDYVHGQVLAVDGGWLGR